jgi:nitronate monooxygenase
LRNDIRKARSITDKPFGVNLSIGLCPSLDEMREVAIEERVPVIFTAAYRAEEHGRRIKEAGLKWVHKVVTVKHAVAAERHGADAVVIVGLEGTAFKNISQLPTLTSITTAARLMKVPIIAAGGIGDARGLLAALAMGAEGVYMGTRFLATKECPVSERYKQKLIDAQPWDAEFRERCLTPPKAEEYDRIMGEKGSVSRDHWLQRLEQVALGQTPAGKEVDWETDVNIEMTLRIAGGSLAVGVIDRVMSVKELIDTIIHDAERIMSKDGNLGRLLR